MLKYGTHNRVSNYSSLPTIDPPDQPVKEIIVSGTTDALDTQLRVIFAGVQYHLGIDPELMINDGQWQLDLTGLMPRPAPGTYDIRVINSAGEAVGSATVVALIPEIAGGTLQILLGGMVSDNIVEVRALGQVVTPQNGRYQLQVFISSDITEVPVTVVADDGRRQTRIIHITQQELADG